MKSALPIFYSMRLLLRHRRLAEKRSLTAEENKIAKFFIYLSMLVAVIYLMGLAIVFSLIVNDDRSHTATEFFCVGLPFVLAVDFFLRFTMQQTPAHIIKPYILLPIPRRVCISAFVASSIYNFGNFVWLAFIIPYVLMSVIFSYGCCVAVGLIVFSQIMIFANSQWYAIARTLINQSQIWWALPFVVYGMEIFPLYLGQEAGWKHLVSVYASVGTMLESHYLIMIAVAAVILTAVTAINHKVQLSGIEKELAKQEKKEVVKRVAKFSFLERYGEIGTFIQLEIKMLLRNRNPRKALINGTITMLMVCAIIVLSDVYDSTGMTNFWGLYAYILFGTMTLMGLMSYEGNYIDCLLTRKENIYTLLQAKYIFYSMFLILPFVLMLPAVVTGKWSLYMLVSYGIFTMGFQYFIVFHVAIYNKVTISLNDKLTDKGKMSGNYVQLVIIALVFIVPNIFVSLLQRCFGETASYTIMLIIGLTFILTHKLWLRYIYNRMMRRKYSNLEGFMATRDN